MIQRNLPSFMRTDFDHSSHIHNFTITFYKVTFLCKGFGSGFMFPTQQMLLGLWAPAEERSRAIMSVNTGEFDSLKWHFVMDHNLLVLGMTIGATIGSIIPGFLSTSWWGWPASFYVIGSIGLVWCAFYLIFGYGSPATHPTITPEERNYIQTSLNQHQDDVRIENIYLYQYLSLYIDLF